MRMKKYKGFNLYYEMDKKVIVISNKGECEIFKIIMDFVFEYFNEVDIIEFNFKGKEIKDKKGFSVMYFEYSLIDSDS